MNAENKPGQARPNAKGGGTRSVAVNVLLFTSMFFATWGSGLQHLTSFPVSKLFPALGGLLILYVLAFSRQKIVFPRLFNAFILFYLAHMAVTYGVFHREEFIFGVVRVRNIAGGFISQQEGAGIVCARVFGFLSFGYALGALLWGKERIHYAAIGYAAGLLFVLWMGGYTLVEASAWHGGEVRSAGGFLDPNSFGFSGLTAACLAGLGLANAGRSRLLRLLHPASILLGLFVIMQSGSRGSLAAFCWGFALVLVNLRNISRQLMIILVAVVLTLSGLILMPESSYETLLQRVSPSRMVGDRGSKRLDIWSAYFEELPRYAVTGVGFARSQDVIRNVRKSEGKLTHNQYFEILVETGLLGLLLFFAALYQLWKGVAVYVAADAPALKPVLLAAMAAVLGEFLFMNCFYSRETWILFGVVAGFTYFRRRYA